MPKPDGPQFVFHGSTESPKEFLKSPFLHVGTGTQAKMIMTGRRIDLDEEPFVNKRDMPEANRYKLMVSPHSDIHDEVFSDIIANTAHRELLKEKNYPVPGSIRDSAYDDSDLTYDDNDHPDDIAEITKNRNAVDRAKNALLQNKIIKYENSAEVPASIRGVPSGVEESSQFYTFKHAAYKHKIKRPPINISYVVPSPSLHLRQPGKKNPVQQPMLPMDYTGVLPQSSRTRQFREP